MWYDLRKSALREKGNLFGALEEVVADLPGFVSKPSTAPMIPNVTIEAVAVWDTVGALGIPKYDGEKNADLFRFADTILSPKVRNGLHAVAIDEQRANFTPTLWNADARIQQVLFPGGDAPPSGGCSLALC